MTYAFCYDDLDDPDIREFVASGFNLLDMMDLDLSPLTIRCDLGFIGVINPACRRYGYTWKWLSRPSDYGEYGTAVLTKAT